MWVSRPPGLDLGDLGRVGHGHTSHTFPGLCGRGEMGTLGRRGDRAPAGSSSSPYGARTQTFPLGIPPLVEGLASSLGITLHVTQPQCFPRITKTLSGGSLVA